MMAMSSELLWDLPRALLGTRTGVVTSDRHIDDRTPRVGRAPEQRPKRPTMPMGSRLGSLRKTDMEEVVRNEAHGDDG